MCGLPSMSSAQLARALQKLGCSASREAAGSHQMWERAVAGSVVRRPLVLGKKDVSHKWLLRVLRAFDITKEQLRSAL